MRTIRAHSRMVVFLSIVVALAAAGAASWLAYGETPTHAQA